MGCAARFRTDDAGRQRNGTTARYHDLSLEEVAEIYLPLSRLLNFYISSNLRRQAVLGSSPPMARRSPLSVLPAVSQKHTTRVLQALLSRWPSTAGGTHHHRWLLHPNAVLKRARPDEKKGFPQSYDMHRLVKFVSDLKSGASQVTAPVCHT